LFCRLPLFKLQILFIMPHHHNVVNVTTSRTPTKMNMILFFLRMFWFFIVIVTKLIKKKKKQKNKLFSREKSFSCVNLKETSLEGLWCDLYNAKSRSNRQRVEVTNKIGYCNFFYLQKTLVNYQKLCLKNIKWILDQQCITCFCFETTTMNIIVHN